MSTTSCPRCSAQVTLPVGVPNETTVRCPLCHAHYTLADALVNMPPLLEVVEATDEALPADWYDAPPGNQAGKPLTAVAIPDDDASEADTLELDGLKLDESLELGADDDAAGRETLDDDLTLPTFNAKEEAAAADDTLLNFDAPEADEPVDVSSEFDEDGLALDFDGDALSAEQAGAETIEFGSERIEALDSDKEDTLQFNLDAAEEPGEDMTLEFGAPVGEEVPDFGEEEVKFNLDDAGDEQAETVQFSGPLDSTSGAIGGGDDPFGDAQASGDQTVEFNFDAEEPAGTDDELRGFEDIRVEPTGEGEDIPLDLPGAPAVTAASPVEDAEATGKKGKKEKKKKEKKAKVVAADGETSKRSLVGSLAGVLLPALIAIPLALYGPLWISKDYDFLGLGGYLPSAMLPAEYNKKPTQLAQYTPPATPGPIAAGEPVEEDDAEENASEEMPADGEATEHVAGRPTDDDAAAPEEEMSADEMPADEAPSLTPESDTPAEAAADDPFAPAPAAEDDLFAPAEAMPEQAADAAPAEDDPFAPAPAEDDPFAPAESMPADAAVPAEDDLFAPAAGETPADAIPADAAEPAEAELFAPAPDEAPAEMPAEDDLFAPAAGETPAEMPDEADPFAPAAGDPPADVPAEADPFAPAPADMPADAPEDADPFGPAPEDKPADAPVTRPTEDDPFAPAAEDEPAAEADPFAPAPADRPAEDDLFAPELVRPEMTPAPAPDARPAEPDPFAPAPAERLPDPAAPELTAPAMPEPGAAGEALGPRNVAAVSPDQVSGAMQATFVAGQQLMAAEVSGNEPELRKARAAFYVNLFGMADAITSAQLGEGAAQIDPQLVALGPTLKQQLAADPKRLEALKVFGARWIEFPKRTTNGVVVSGTVESAEQVGKLFHTKARLGNADAPLVTIVTAEQPEVAAGDTVLALGSIVDDPSRQISGYEGSDPTVVWSGLTMKVAP